MKEKVLNWSGTLFLTFGGILLLLWWFLNNPVKDFKESMPGMDNKPANITISEAKVNIGALFSKSKGSPAHIVGNWPRFRGTNFDNISNEQEKLIDSWDQEPKILWSIPMGEGHAGPVIHKGKVYILDYDEKQKADLLRCLSFKDGKEIWQRGYNINIKRNHGVSRTVAAVTDKFVVTMGPKCHVMCVGTETGNFLWGIDLNREYGTEVPLWYTGQCPLIEDSVAIIAPGGDSLMLGIDCESGQVLWKTPNPNKWQMSHSSILPINYKGKRIYVYCAIGGIVGVSADKENRGAILFASSLWNHKVIAPSPVYIGKGKLFVTAGYGKGSMLLQIQADSLPQSDLPFKLSVLQTVKPHEGIASEQQTPIFYNGCLFSILPKDAGSNRNQMVCVPPDNLNKIKWYSGKTNRFGLGPYLLADGKFYVLSDDGFLTIIKASTEEYLQLDRKRILEGVDAWGPMALVQGRLLARDSKRLVCVDLRANN
jgi:outer membrane protein assembly factor BamB